MRLLSQHRGSLSLADFLLQHLRDPSWTTFRAAVAFAKRSGTKYLREELPPFALRGTVKVSVGVNLRGTSQEALSDLLAYTKPGEVWIFHDEGGPTFHPKVYLFKNDRQAELLVGSGNLTEGGLVANYEASLASSLDLTTPHGRQLLAEAEEMLDRYCDPTDGAVRRLDHALLAELFTHGYIPATDAATRSPDRTTASNSAASGFASDRLFHPSLHRPSRIAAARPHLPKADTTPGPMGPLAAPNAPPTTLPSAFIMTLQQTDVGRGQTTPGTQKRSAEVFIPLEAVRAHPEFWRWREAFVERTTNKGNKHWFRDNVIFRIGKDLFNVNMMESTVKRDLRLRSERLRSSGSIGDILRIERDGDGYAVEVVPQGDPRFEELFEQTRKVNKPNSPKRYGYY